MFAKDKILKKRCQYNHPAIQLACDLLRLAGSPDFSNSKKLTKGVIQAVFSLIRLIDESMKKSVIEEPLKFLNKVYSTTAVLYGQIKVFRESGYLSESDFIDHLDKITTMKHEFNAILLHSYNPAQQPLIMAHSKPNKVDNKQELHYNEKH